MSLHDVYFICDNLLSDSFLTWKIGVEVKYERLIAYIKYAKLIIVAKVNGKYKILEVLKLTSGFKRIFQSKTVSVIVVVSLPLVVIIIFVSGVLLQFKKKLY